MKVGDIVCIDRGLGEGKKYVAKIVDTAHAGSWAVEIISSKESVGHSLGGKLIGSKREQGWFAKEANMSLIPQEETGDKKFRTGMRVETVEDIPFSPIKKGARGIVARAKKEFGYNYLGVFFDIGDIDKYVKKENISLLNSLDFGCTPGGYSTGYWVDASFVKIVEEGDEGEAVELEAISASISVGGRPLEKGERTVVDPVKGVARILGPNGEVLSEFKLGGAGEVVFSTQAEIGGIRAETVTVEELTSPKKIEQLTILTDRKDIPATYSWVARDQDGKLFAYPAKPVLDYRKTQWYGEHGKKVEDTLFSFLTFSRGPLNIREVL